MKVLRNFFVVPIMVHEHERREGFETPEPGVILKSL